MKTNISDIDKFMNLKSFAIIGVSAKKKKFGNSIFAELKKRGLKIYPIHRTAGLIDGEKCYPGIESLPEKPEGIILVIPPAETEKAVKDIAKAGITNVWMQLGADSKPAIDYCTGNGINVIRNECLLMFLQKPGFPHNVHKWIWNRVN
ncbi:MAG: CoA-binding protein [Ignavibacteria bacterium]